MLQKHFLRANFTPTCLKIKKHLWANCFKSPALACVFHKISPEPPWECKQLRDADDHPEYIIRFNSNKLQMAILEHLGEKRKT